MNPQVLSGSDLTAIDIRRARGRAYRDNLQAKIPFWEITNLLLSLCELFGIKFCSIFGTMTSSLEERHGRTRILAGVGT
jgi:hypothetical protein